jgi:hypothetical protein
MKVAICTPIHGEPAAEYAHSLFNLGIHTTRERPDIELKRFCTGSSNLPALRNRITQQALEWGADWLLRIDADQSFPADALLRLLAHDLPAVGCGCAQKTLPATPAAPLPTTKAKADAKLIEPVPYLGLAVFLVSAAVVRRLPTPHFAFAPARNGIDTFGEDFHFCHLLKQAGIAVMLDHGLSWEIGHVGRFVFYNTHVEHHENRRAREREESPS